MNGPEDAVRHGVGLVPEDRKLQGLVLNMSVQANVSLATLKRLTKGLFVDRRRERQLALDFLEHLHIKARHPDQEVGYLSGGNQQKVVLAKWLALKPKVLILGRTHTRRRRRCQGRDPRSHQPVRRRGNGDGPGFLGAPGDPRHVRPRAGDVQGRHQW